MRSRFFNMIIPLVLAFSNAGAQEKSPPLKLPFAEGEKLVYAVQYMGITAGEAIMAVHKPIVFEGHDVYPLLSTIQSTPFVSHIYPINDRVESYMDAKELYSHRIDVNQQEGKRKREKQIVFDQELHKATQIKQGQQEIFDIPPGVHDFLSVLYYLRLHPLKTGPSIFADVHESGNNWKVEIRILDKETVTVPSGTFETVKVQVVSRFEGLFLTKRDLFLWITDDDRRIPVRIQSKITVGSVILNLTSLQTGRGE